MKNRFTLEEATYLLKLIREQLADLALGLHRYWLVRSNKSKSQEEMLPEMKREKTLLESIRNKLWRMRHETDERERKWRRPDSDDTK